MWCRLIVSFPKQHLQSNSMLLYYICPLQALPVASASAAMVWGAIKALSSYLLCILLPGAFGALRAVLTGVYSRAIKRPADAPIF